MMTKKSEMAEWILDFFRRAKVGAGQIIMFRNLQHAQRQLNPKERTLFLNTMNELLEHDYFTFEQEPLQCLRLSRKGCDYIYDSGAVLDCCHDRKMTLIQQQYITNWYNAFTAYITQLKISIAALMLMPEASEEDRQGLKHCLNMLDGNEVNEILDALNESNVSNKVLDLIEKLNKELFDIALDRLRNYVLMKAFVRTLAYTRIEQERKAEEMRLENMNIPLL